MSSQDDPSNQSTHFDYSRNEASYENYTNNGQHGVINNLNIIGHQTTNYKSTDLSPLAEELRQHCSPSAAFNSATRCKFDPPPSRCAESTRLRIVQIIEEWMNSDGENAAIFWLYGGAGAGKSALAQSLSEKFQEELAASFFFFRGDSTRNDGDGLIPTFVSQLANTLREFVPFVEDRIRKDWHLFTKMYDIQIQELLVEPLLSLKLTNVLAFPPRLFVIDGLDECTDPNVQCLLLRAIAHALPRIPYPLRFLITSRPEAHITHVFNHDPALQTILVQRYNLSDDPDADMDIRNFLEKEFVDIRRTHRLGKHLPHTWPDQQVINSLVERSSGHFIYASTVVRYIQCPKHRPDDRLEIILRLRPSQEGDEPYAQLDALYGLIFGSVESHVQLERICLVLGILYFQIKKCGFLSRARDCTMIESILRMKAGDLVLLLDPILSLVAIEGGEIRIYHKPLFDYLLVRGSHLPFDLHRVHETAATYILTQKIAKAACDMSDFQHFAFHCRYGYLNNTLKDYLVSLEVPCPKFLMTTFDIFPPWKDHQNFLLRKSMWHFFRTMSRQDFDSTGRVYEQYLRKWITHFRSAVSEESPLHVSKVDALKVWFKRGIQKTSEQAEGPTLNTNVIDVKRKLDKLLAEWRPKDFQVHRQDAKGTNPEVRHIEQEHRIFSAYVKASFPDHANETASSLVCGEDFIHVYTFTMWDHGWPMVVSTYSTHGNSSFRPSWAWEGASYPVTAMAYHLENVENQLASDHFIKYGLVNDSESFDTRNFRYT